jgi:hypothetical protein
LPWFKKLGFRIAWVQETGVRIAVVADNPEAHAMDGADLGGVKKHYWNK